ncbi:uncharacterized protein LOC113311201 [Papaver somniferum]|uniref:uncharacterized protein LOC113311201 n=1 Tax=Papaver somniferum TaxID=3469 RepID=UPI000E700691|nr:uncharacterized protein LOC113311201 [Papaver somniferum]
MSLKSREKQPDLGARVKGTKKVTSSARRERTAKETSSAQDKGVKPRDQQDTEQVVDPSATQGTEEVQETGAPQVTLEVQNTSAQEETQGTQDASAPQASAPQGTQGPSAPQPQGEIFPVVQEKGQPSSTQEGGKSSGTKKDKRGVQGKKKDISKKATHLFPDYLKFHQDIVRLLKPAPKKKTLEWPLSGECERFKMIIHHSGLYPVVENSLLEHDRVAIYAFLERLCPETDTFHMPFGEMTITPDDIVQILNLPVQGTAVKLNYTKQLSWTQLYVLTKKCLGWDEETTTAEFMWHASYKTRQININQLMSMYRGTLDKERNGTLTDDQVNQVTTAYLLCVLGCVIFPNTTGNHIDANLTQLLDTLHEVGDYSWGTECLAHLMEELRKASRQATIQVGGNVSLLQVFIISITLLIIMLIR